MTQQVVKFSKELKGSMSEVRAHLQAVERAGDMLQAAIKRAEANYKEQIKRAFAILADDEEEPAEATNEQQPQEAEAQTA